LATALQDRIFIIGLEKFNQHLLSLLLKAEKIPEKQDSIF